MYIDHSGQIMLWLTIMESQQSLPLCWCSFSRWGRECFTFYFDYKGSQYFIYDNLQPVTPQITQDTQLTIVDALLMFICKVGQWGCRQLCWLERRPIFLSWLSATDQMCDYPPHLTKNLVHSIEALFKITYGALSYIVWQSRRLILRLCITMTKSIFNSQSYII